MLMARTRFALPGLTAALFFGVALTSAAAPAATATATAAREAVVASSQAQQHGATPPGHLSLHDELPRSDRATQARSNNALAKVAVPDARITALAALLFAISVGALHAMRRLHCASGRLAPMLGERRLVDSEQR